MAELNSSSTHVDQAYQQKKADYIRNFTEKAHRASDEQISGDHYKKMGDYQPWDVMQHWLTPEEYRGYQKGTAIAYLAREKDKGGDADIAKAAHHLRKLLEVIAK